MNAKTLNTIGQLVAQLENIKLEIEEFQVEKRRNSAICLRVCNNPKQLNAWRLLRRIFPRRPPPWMERLLPSTIFSSKRPYLEGLFAL
jgi:hypothetical protein